MSDIVQIYKEFKSEVEKKDFLKKQQEVITNLMNKNKQLEEEVAHLKALLTSTTQVIGEENKVTIVSAEEGLIDRQIELIRERGLERELTLEDTKKLDLLLKNKKIAKENNATIPAESKKIDKKDLTHSELIQIASLKKEQKVE